jgi:zinc protease
MNVESRATPGHSSTLEYGSLPGPECIGRRVFPNGSIGLAWENQSSASVFVYGWLWTGSIDESPEQAGLASMTASLLTRGTENRTMLQISQEIESLGAAIGIHGGSHTTTFTAKCLLEDLDQVLDVLTDCLHRPTFPQAQIERRRGQVLTALEQRENDTRAMANLRYYELMYPNHPYGRSAIGYPSTIKGLTRDDVYAFYRTHYGARRAGAAIAGPLPTEQGLDRLETALGTWQGAEHTPPSLPPVSFLDALRRAYTPIPDKAQSDIYLGWPGPRRRDADYIPAHLANCVLGQFGMMGRLGEQVRDVQGLAYYSYSALSAGLEPGTWTAVAGVAPENVERAQDSIRTEVARLQNEPVPEQELNDNKDYLIGSLPLRLETKERVAYQIAYMERLDLGLDYLRRYPGLIQAVTQKEIIAVAQKYMNPEQFVLSVAGPPTDSTDKE